MLWVGVSLLVQCLVLVQGQTARQACTCSGYINQRGQGECRTVYKVAIPVVLVVVATAVEVVY